MLLKVLQEQLTRYPRMQPQDLVKLIYQNEFAGGHMVSTASEAVLRIKQELASLDEQKREAKEVSDSGWEDIGNDLCRFHLQGLREYGLSAETLGHIFYYSSGTPRGSKENFIRQLEMAEQACIKGALPCDAAAFSQYLRQYLARGVTHPGHSAVYRRHYSPAYRVIKKEYCYLLRIFAVIDKLLAKNAIITIALEGNSGAGKSALAELLGNIYRSNVFHMDDFFLRPEQRTEQRLAEAGGNIDHERFRSEITSNLNRHCEFSYRRFNCRIMALTDTITVSPQPLNIIEGVYSLHPKLEIKYDLAIFLSVSGDEQRRRILQRDGIEMLRRFEQEWIPLENRYFTEFRIRNKCDLQYDSEKMQIIDST